MGCVAAAHDLAVVGDTVEKDLRAVCDGLRQRVLDLQLDLRAVLEMLDDAFIDVHVYLSLYAENEY